MATELVRLTFKAAGQNSEEQLSRRSKQLFSHLLLINTSSCRIRNITTKKRQQQLHNRFWQQAKWEFLATLAALGLPWSLTHLLTFMSLCWIQSLPDQTPNLANLMGVIRKQKDNDKDKENDNENDKYIYKTPSKSDLWDFWPLKHFIRVMRKHDLTNKKTTTKTNTKDKDNDKYI